MTILDNNKAISLEAFLNTVYNTSGIPHYIKISVKLVFVVVF